MRAASVLLVGSLALGPVACRDAKAPPATLDSRTAVVLPPDAVEAVHAEMRTMLTSLQQVQLGLATRDTALARRGAEASGLAAAADPHLDSLLPAEFMRMAVATHSGFDSLAQVISAGHPVDSALVRLARITEACVACHGVYRLSPGPPTAAH